MQSEKAFAAACVCGSVPLYDPYKRGAAAEEAKKEEQEQEEGPSLAPRPALRVVTASSVGRTAL